MATTKTTKTKAKRYVLVRTYSAGVHVGVVVERDLGAPSVIVLTEARRIWSWQGRLSLSEVSQSGVGPGSKVSVPVGRMELSGVIEVIDCSAEGETALRSAPAHVVR